MNIFPDSCKDQARRNIVGSDLEAGMAQGDKGVQSKSTKDEYIKKCWSDREMNLREIARRLNIDDRTVLRRALRLGLPYPRPGNDQRRLKDRFGKKRASYRARWLQVMKSHPKYGVQKLRTLKPKLYAWLDRFDPNWLHTHKPASKRLAGNPRTDWSRVDREIAKAIPAAAQEIRHQTGRRRRINQTEILREIGKSKEFSNNRYDLPLTEKALKKFAESREDHALRKIQWAVKHYGENHIHISKARLFYRLGIKWAVGNPTIMQAFEEAYAELVRREYSNRSTIDK